MKRKITVVGLLAGFFALMPSVGSCQDYKIGVLANRGPLQAFKEWKATADYLSDRTGKTFAIVPLEYDQVPAWTKDKKIDFVLTNPAMYVELNKLYGVQAVATQVDQYKGQLLDRFGSTLLVRQDSNIENLSDVKGKDIACASRSAFGGWLIVMRLFFENGVNPDTDFKSVRELKTHDNVVYAVLNGAVAAGCVRTGTLEKMVQEGKVKISDFRVLRRIADDFPLLHSTQLYPEYPMAACQHVPSEMKNLVSKSLTAMAPSDAAAVAVKLAGWKEPLDYSSVSECLTVVKAGALKNAGQASPALGATEKLTASTPVPETPATGRVRSHRERPSSP